MAKGLKSLKVLSLTFLVLIACKKKEQVEVGDEPTPEEPIEDNSSLVYLSTQGKLIYNRYANEGETNKDNRVPDFSGAGYSGGGVALPEVSVKKTISPIAGDNRINIQNAINEVAELPPDVNGYRGAVLLKAGVYDVEGALQITKSGIVIRGEGQGSTGSIIRATKRAQHSLIEIKGTGSGTGEITGTRKKITTGYVPTGSNTFDIENAEGIIAGDEIAVYRVPNKQWVDDIQMSQYGWTADGYDIAYERKVLSVSANTITLDAPVVDPLQTKYGGGYIFKTNISGRVNNCGVENLRLTSVYVNDDDEKHGWVAVELIRAENCWVKQVTALYFGYACVSISDQSIYNTVEECAMLDPKSETTGGRKYSFNLEAGASFNLFQRCFTRGGRHDFVTGSRVPGPNVFLDSYATDTYADIGPHHRWATGLLFDNIYGGEIRTQNRKDMGSGHGWAGAQSMFWNCKSYKNDIKVESPKGARNWGIGCTGLARNGNGYWESWGVNVNPRSLYLAQLKERMGEVAVNKVTTEAQRKGNIFNLLKNWAGEGKLPSQ
ncbi:hypothetical protein [Desertivirga arenae]|uniref:hypothetical protein n=1 Tax=Desertivirga arenae TaxID=2810309 RepID=UPI001A972170|nr:hypothetical protein [Pedobacter sp. SYSU D00823]